jgi:hypothetical protein
MGLAAAQVNRAASPAFLIAREPEYDWFRDAARIKPDLTKWSFQTRHSFSSPIAGTPGVR